MSTWRRSVRRSFMWSPNQSRMKVRVWQSLAWYPPTPLRVAEVSSQKEAVVVVVTDGEGGGRCTRCRQPQRDPVKLVCTALSTFGKTVVGSLNHSNTYSSRHTNQCIFIETAACESCLNRRCCQRRNTYSDWQHFHKRTLDIAVSVSTLGYMKLGNAFE
jgi:hypothetical protein